MNRQFFLRDERETIELGKRVGELMAAGGTLYLTGTLGAGKTTLTRGILFSFGYSGAVKSPTYTLVEPYEFPQITVYHFDLYRLGEPEELEFMGIRDYFLDKNLCVVEWPERGLGVLPVADMTLSLSVVDDHRRADIFANNKKGENLIARI